MGRAQQLLYHLARMFREHAVKPFPIYLDSPMAIAATQLYAKHQALMDEEAVALQRPGQLKADLATLITCQTPDESRALNAIEGPCIIMAPPSLFARNKRAWRRTMTIFFSLNGIGHSKANFPSAAHFLAGGFLKL